MAALYSIGGALIGSASVALAVGQDGRWGTAIAIGVAIILAAAFNER